MTTTSTSTFPSSAGYAVSGVVSIHRERFAGSTTSDSHGDPVLNPGYLLASATSGCFAPFGARYRMAMEYGYALSAEEHSPPDLVRHAVAAERTGFGFGLISDHIHPWVDAQGHSAFVWSVLGGIAQATNRFRIGTGVTCPMIRIHPAIIAHAAATVACLMPGRFFLGVGTGENLNEHVTGAKWPARDERVEMLEEAVEVIRLLWQGGYQTHRGKHYTVEDLRIFDLPDEPIELAIAAMKPQAAELAGKIGDALISVAPKEQIIDKFEDAGGKGKPKYGQITVCYAKSKDNAKKTAFEVWPNALVEGSASQELPLPSDFEQLVSGREADEVEGTLTLGPDVDEYVDKVKEYDKAGYTHVYFHHVGPDQDAFLAFAQNELLPGL
jgi:coenzyme F420-dependent glucose-6-phosphate dehydrogenase